MAVQVSKTYRLGDFSLDPEKRGLTRGDKQLRLANRPFHVLLYLIEHRERLVTRAELLELFWQGKDVYDETLTKCVGAIRKALDDRLEHPFFIETRYAEGYRFIGPLEEQLINSAPGVVEYERTRGIKIVVEEEEIHDSDPAREPAQPVPIPAATLSLSSPKSSRRLMTLTLIAAVVAASALAVYRMGVHNTVNSPASLPAPVRSIAILPLQNLTGDASKDYLCDGMTDGLISLFSKYQNLKVISRTSVFTFKDKAVDPREIGRQLGVESLLEGNLKMNGDRLRAEVRLVATSDGRVLWTSDALERPMSDVFEIQDGMACIIGTELRVRLCGEGESNKSRTKNNEAYEAYLKGRQHWHRRSAEDMREAISYFERAVKLDPNYALAYAGLADAYAVMEVNSLVPPLTAAPKAKEYARKALDLDDTLAAPYAALGLVTALSDWNWEAGDQLFRQALARDPGYATAHHWYAYSLTMRRRFDEAETEFKSARELDPLSIGIANSVAEFYCYSRQFDRCIEAAEETLRLSPAPTGNSYRVLAIAYLHKGMNAEARKNSEKISYPYFLSSEQLNGEGADKLRHQLDAAVHDKPENKNPFDTAEKYARIGDKEKAVAWLQKAYAAHQADLVSLNVSEAFDSIRDDPRCADLLRRMNLLA